MMRAIPTPAPGRLTSTTVVADVAYRLDVEVLAFVPSTPRPPHGHPLLLYLHGRGERATIDAVGSFGPPMRARTDASFPWAVVAPRCPPGRGWEATELVALLDLVLAWMPVDPDRVVLTGVSMGGFGTWSTVMSYPERFAAAVPVCGGAPVAIPELISDAGLERLRAVPIRAYHGADDGVVPVDESQSIVDSLRRLGCDVELTVYDDVGHDSWTRTYADPGLWSWLWDRRRASVSAR